jgi:hypothetical protein
MSMKPLAVASLILLALPACGGPKEEDVLTGDKIRASQSAPELPDVQLSENPEPPPAPPPPEPTANELDNAADENVIEAGVPGNVPPAFQGLWGVTASDCRPGEVSGNAILLTSDQMISTGSVASLGGVLADSPGRFDGRFTGEGGYESREQLTLGGGGNLLTRNSGGTRTVYQRCIGARPTG